MACSATRNVIRLYEITSKWSVKLGGALDAENAGGAGLATFLWQRKCLDRSANWRTVSHNPMYLFGMVDGVKLIVCFPVLAHR
jgi:hypothetical protein